MPEKRDQLQKLADDIRDIRRALYKNRNILQKWLNAGSTLFIYIYTGVLVIAVSSLHYYFIGAYHGYTSIPLTIRSLLIIGFVFGMAVPGTVKLLFLNKLSDQYPDTKSVGLILKLFGASQMFFYLVLELIIIVLCVYFGISGAAHYCVPVVSIGIGVVMASVWGQFSIPELIAFGLWLMVTGLLSIPFISKSPNDAWIWMAVCLGLGCLVMPVFTRIKNMVRKG